VTHDPWSDPPTGVEQTEETRPAAATRRPSRARGGSDLRIGAIVAIVLLAALVAWLVVRHNSGSSSKNSPVPGRAQAVAVSPAGLVTLSNSSRQPIYWAGRKRGDTYELTKASDGRVWVRYLPAGVAAGSNSPYLTIGTYPLGNAYAVTRRLARKKGSTEVNVPGRAVAFYTTPTNVYVAFPGIPYQIEVYSPSTSEAQSTVASGAVTPVATTSSGTTQSAHFVSVAALKKFASSLGRPLYWAGPQSGTRYELTQTSNGNVYLLYLIHN
jgi:hypothetical protein